VRVIKAVHVVDAGAVTTARAVGRWADAILLDTKTDTRIGGTGATHDWSISARIVKEANKPVILSGGLNPQNVRDAIAVVSPFAVDVNSGVENPDGSKSPEKVWSLIRLAKAAGEPSPLTAELFSGSAWR
jgi:phosphoribosylanthranilate isomerase